MYEDQTQNYHDQEIHEIQKFSKQCLIHYTLSHLFTRTQGPFGPTISPTFPCAVLILQPLPVCITLWLFFQGVR